MEEGAGGRVGGGEVGGGEEGRREVKEQKL